MLVMRVHGLREGAATDDKGVCARSRARTEQGQRATRIVAKHMHEPNGNTNYLDERAHGAWGNTMTDTKTNGPDIDISPTAPPWYGMIFLVACVCGLGVLLDVLREST